MGVIPPQLLDDWERQQKQDHAAKANYTVAQLPCCGSSVEIQGGIDQYVTCPNAQCPRARELGRPPRHFISWSIDPKVTKSEQPPLQL
jgi:hypothetical protein